MKKFQIDIEEQVSNLRRVTIEVDDEEADQGYMKHLINSANNRFDESGASGEDYEFYLIELLEEEGIEFELDRIESYGDPNVEADYYETAEDEL